MTGTFLGQMKIYAGARPPRGWALADGTMLMMSQHAALSLLFGTTYGTSGVNTFALPDMRGRAPVHIGEGSGLMPWVLGQTAGSETVHLSQEQMPKHDHRLQASLREATSTSPEWNALATVSELFYAEPLYPLINISEKAVAEEGQGQGHENMMPFQVLNFIICMDGRYPDFV